MPLKLLPSTPMIALNAAFMKVRPLRLDFDLFGLIEDEIRIVEGRDVEIIKQ